MTGNQSIPPKRSHHKKEPALVDPEAERQETLRRERGEREQRYAVKQERKPEGFWARVWAWLKDW